MSTLHAAASHLILSQDKAGCIRMGDDVYLYQDAVRIHQEGLRIHADTVARAAVRQ